VSEPRRRAAPRRDREESPHDGDERISLDVLPPPIAPVTSVADADEGLKPRRRVRRPRTDEGETDIAPAA
jgi:hypothetical protein